MSEEGEGEEEGEQESNSDSESSVEDDIVSDEDRLKFTLPEDSSDVEEQEKGEALEE